MIKKVKKQSNTLLIILVVWFAISAVYIVQDLWRNGLSYTYQAGYQKAVSTIIVNSEACQPFEVFLGEARTQLISIPCLEAAQKAQQQQAQLQQAQAPANAETPTN